VRAVYSIVYREARSLGRRARAQCMDARTAAPPDPRPDDRSVGLRYRSVDHRMIESAFVTRQSFVVQPAGRTAALQSPVRTRSQRPAGRQGRACREVDGASAPVSAPVAKPDGRASDPVET
jgi:hypothetical protein